MEAESSTIRSRSMRFWSLIQNVDWRARTPTDTHISLNPRFGSSSAAMVSHLSWAGPMRAPCTWWTQQNRFQNGSSGPEHTTPNRISTSSSTTAELSLSPRLHADMLRWRGARSSWMERAGSQSESSSMPRAVTHISFRTWRPSANTRPHQHTRARACRSDETYRNLMKGSAWCWSSGTRGAEDDLRSNWTSNRSRFWLIRADPGGMQQEMRSSGQNHPRGSKPERQKAAGTFLGRTTESRVTTKMHGPG